MKIYKQCLLYRAKSESNKYSKKNITIVMMAHTFRLDKDGKGSVMYFALVKSFVTNGAACQI